jgi:hypothetical protein
MDGKARRKSAATISTTDSPTKRLLFLDDSTANIPVENDQIVIDPPCSGEACGCDACLQI